MTPDLPVADLMMPLPDGQPSISCYTDFLRITGEQDTSETFQIWLVAAYTLMKPPAGRC